MSHVHAMQWERWVYVYCICNRKSAFTELIKWNTLQKERRPEKKLICTFVPGV